MGRLANLCRLTAILWLLGTAASGCGSDPAAPVPGFLLGGPVVTITSFVSTPPTVLANESVMLSWESSYADSCSIDQSVGDVAVSGSAGPVMIPVTTTFEITCQGPGGPASRTVTATVTPPVEILSFTADPAVIGLGSSATLEWEVDYATSCSIDGDVGNVNASGGTVLVSPEDDQTYELTCQGAGGPVSDDVDVEVVIPVTVDSFTASSLFVGPGAMVELSWTTSLATSCEIDPGDIDATPVAAGSTMVTVNNSTAYTLTCEGPAGPAIRERPVWVPGEIAGGMAPVPAGCADLGNPAMMTTEVCFDDFAMAVYETTNAEYLACVLAGACLEPVRNPTYHLPELADYPITSVDRYSASTYCAWRGRSLPPADEWEYAALGGMEGVDFPWGNSVSEGDANCCGAGAGAIVVVGQYPANGYGIHDVIGNVWEWVDTVASASRYIVKGGTVVSSESVSAIWYRGTAHTAGDPYNDLGFRCMEQ